MPKEQLDGEVGKETYAKEELLREAEVYKEERIGSGLNQPSEFEGDGFYNSFLNNFHSHLPGGYKRGIPKFAQLERDIDNAIERLGLEAQEIAQWKKEDKVSPEERQKRLETYKTLYIEMRNLGYPHYPDLSA